MKRGRIILIVLLVGILIAGSAVYYVFNKPHREVESETAIELNAGDLFKSYTQNEKQANTQYLDKAIQVKGEIEEVRSNQENKTVLVFKSGDPIFGVVCTFREGVQGLAKGGQAIVKGLCSGYDGNDVKLRDCILVNPK